jgi:glycine oxidase
LQARALAQAGWRVSVYDQGEIGRESSWAGGGILSPLYPWRYPDAVTRLARWSQEFYPQLSRELIAEGGVDPQWTQSGLLVLDTDEQLEAKAWATHWNLHCEWLDRPQLLQLLPELALPIEHALWFPALGQIRNPRLVKSLYVCDERLGVVFHPRQQVCSLLREGQRVIGIETEQGEVRADRVVIAGGAWSAGLLHGMLELPVRPVKGQMLLLSGKPGQLQPIVLYQDRYLIPRQDGRILVGSTLEETGFDKATTEDARDELLGFVKRLVPGLASLPVERHWAGLRPGSPTGIPYIGAIAGWDGLYVNTGHFRNGVVLGPASARLLADMLLNRETIVDPLPYKIT